MHKTRNMMRYCICGVRYGPDATVIGFRVTTVFPWLHVSSREDTLAVTPPVIPWPDQRTAKEVDDGSSGLQS